MPSPVLNFTNTPPGSPADGDRYVCGTSPTGAWSGQANKYATRLGGAWEFRAPIEGDLVYDQTADAHKLYDGSAWNLFTVQINSTKDSVRVASTANVTISSPGSTIDGVTMATNDRVLLKDQSTGSQNGIYVWNGAASAMTRATDFDASTKVQPNVVIGVQEGTANADKQFQLTTNAPITLGTTALTFAEFGGASSGNATSIQGVSVSATSPTNGQALVYNGTVWIPTTLTGGGDELYPTTAVVSADWATWFNQGGATPNDADGGIAMVLPLGSAPPTFNFRGRVRASPSTPWTRQATIEMDEWSRSLSGGGVVFRDSASGKFVVIYWAQGTLNFENWDSATSVNGTSAAQKSSVTSPPRFWRMRDDNTDRFVDISRDGRTWSNVYQKTRTNFCTPDQIGIAGINNSSTSGPVADYVVALISWS